MRVAIIGSNGQLGTDLVRAFPSHQTIAWTRRDFDILDHKRVSEALDLARPDAVINTAVFHKAEACENNPELAFAVNATAVANLARVCDDRGVTLVHISTDYVFDGEKGTPYSEEDCPRPINAYGISKLAGEHFVGSICARSYIVRVASLFGAGAARKERGNFVETMLGKATEEREVFVANDVRMSPTFAADAAMGIRQLVEASPPFGVYHIVNAGSCTWYEFARAIFDFAGVDVRLQAWNSAAASPRVRRPRNTVLSCDKFEAATFTSLRSWKEALASYLSHTEVARKPLGSR